jgi:acetylornithine deacetylase/succinyl-diaminopimelate desuccinylase-like protein
MLKEKVKAFVNKHKDEIISTLVELVKIPSVSTDRENCEKMLLAVKELYQKYGFETKEGD